MSTDEKQARKEFRDDLILDCDGLLNVVALLGKGALLFSKKVRATIEAIQRKEPIDNADLCTELAAIAEMVESSFDMIRETANHVVNEKIELLDQLR